MSDLDWAEASSTYVEIDRFVYYVAKILTETDEITAADNCIRKYEEAIPSLGAQYINLCNIKCYRYWFVNDFEQAMHWGTQGVELKRRSKVDTKFDCEHNLALATRDAGNYDAALKSFLLGESLDKVLSEDHLDSNRGGPYYGNIGRCLQFKAEYEKALRCYKKSARFLEEGKYSTSLNRGYVRYWVGQVLAKQGRWEAAFYALIAAVRIWKDVAPARAASIEDEIQVVQRKLADFVDPVTVPDWKAENRFLSWLRAST